MKAGSTLVNGSLDVQTTSLISENTLAAVATLVERAQASRTRYQELADRVAAKLLPIALCVSVVASIAWGLASRYARNESTSSSAVAGVTYAIAVMAVSCPCAIGLAVSFIQASKSAAHIDSRCSGALDSVQHIAAGSQGRGRLQSAFRRRSNGQNQSFRF